MLCREMNDVCSETQKNTQMHLVDRQLKIFILNVEINKKKTRFKNVINLPLEITYCYLVTAAMCVSQKLNLDINRTLTKCGFTDSFYIYVHIYSVLISFEVRSPERAI